MVRTKVRRTPIPDAGDLRLYATTDGLGVLKPSDASTGVLPGVARDTVVGNVTLSTAGTTYVNKTVTGRVTVTAANVIIKNVQADEFFFEALGVSNALMEDCTVRPDTQSFVHGGGIVGHDYTARRVKISGHIDGAVIRNNPFFVANGAVPYQSGVVWEHVWVNRMAWWTDDVVGTIHTTDRFTHNDGIQHMGGYGTRLEGCFIDASFERNYAHFQMVGGSLTEPYNFVPLNSLADGGPYYVPPDRESGTAADGRYNTDLANPTKACSLTGFLIGNNQGPSRELVFTNNWWAGGDFGFNGGGFNRGTETTTLMTMTGNRFSRDQGTQMTGGDATFTVGGFGTGWDAFIVRSGNVYEDNGNPITFRT